MMTSLDQPSVPTDAVRIARKATAQFKPTAWVVRLAVPAALIWSFLRGNADYWVGRGLPWLLVVVALQTAAVALVARLSRNVTRAGADAAASGDPDALARLLRRISWLPNAVLLPVLLLSLPALFVAILAPAIVNIGSTF